MIGYARVSTSGQTVSMQREQLRAAGCTAIFGETASGASGHRVELARALAALGEGDVLVVTRLDRLARSTRDLLEIVASIEARGARLRSLAEAWADTATPAGRLMLTVLGGLAEFERSLIRERTAEGRARAMKAGRRFGRPPLLTPPQREEAVRLAGEERSHAEIARILRVSRSTVSRFLQRHRAGL